jgi:hypothetical protein
MRGIVQGPLARPKLLVERAQSMLPLAGLRLWQRKLLLRCTAPRVGRVAVVD